MKYNIRKNGAIHSIELPKILSRKRASQNNFSQNTSEEDFYSVNRNNSRKVRHKKRRGFKILKFLFVLILTVGILSLTFIAGSVKGILDSTPTINSFHFGPSSFATKIYDRNGNLTDTLIMAGSNRETTTYEEIPANLINAFVAIEDERFWQHSGIDLKSILRAVFGVVFSNSSLGGGSTITQQLIKNAIFDTAINEKGFEKYVRKLQEQQIALQYESQEGMSKKEIKEQIITDYLNIINLGSNTLGVKVAAKRYFNKELKDLTISECAVIASITKNPSKNNPIKHPEENRKRQLQVLDNMLRLGYITNEEHKEAMDDDVYSRIKYNDVQTETVQTAYTYFTEALIDQVTNDLVKKLGYSQLLANNLLYSGGLSIYTTEDPNIKSIIDKEVNDDKNYKAKKYALDYRLSIRHKDDTQTHYSQGDIKSHQINVLKNSKFDGLFTSIESCDKAIENFKKYIMKDTDEIAGEVVNYVLEPQCSFVLINHTNGEVLGLSGGRGEKTVSRSLNRATKTLRQPGSTFKVLATFAPALELYEKTLATTYYDSEYVYKNKTFKNWYSSGYLGFQNIRAGIAYSLNIVAVKCLMQTVSPEIGVNFAQKLGISTLTKEDYNPATALGGLTNGVSNIELTNAFATIANKGIYNETKLYTKIIDHNGKVLIDNTKTKPQRVLSEENAWLLTSAMADSMISKNIYSGSITVNTTSTRAHFSGQDQAGKSGTTTNNNDVWFVGYTPYYTAGVWGGCDENQTLQNSSKKINNGGTAFHKDIWRKIMTEVHKDLSNKKFTRPSSLVKREVCRKSGLLATDGCKKDLRGDCSYTEYFVDGTQPRKYCTTHAEDGLLLLPQNLYDTGTDDTNYVKIVLPEEPIITPVIPIIDNQTHTSNRSPVVIENSGPPGSER